MIALLLLVAILAVGAGFYARILFLRYLEERRERARLLGIFSRYVPAPVIEDLLARKDPRLFEAREYYATILCCRIRNFALFAESLLPEETLRYLNEFYTIVGQAVQRHRGMIESLRGDEVTAVFGVLVDEQFQEERSLRAALDVMRVFKAMEARWESQGRKAFTIGIGVNSGKIVAGATGFQQRREFAIVGNPAHVAQQLEHASEELNATIVTSEATYAAVRDLFVAVPTSSIPLRGLRRLQNAYIVRGLSKRNTTEDTLAMPQQRSFKRTIVHAGEPMAEGIEPDAYIDPEERVAARYDAAPAAVAAIDARIGGIETFEGGARFSRYDDATPALPEIPALEGTYEDDQGPPIQLPP